MKNLKYTIKERPELVICGALFILLLILILPVKITGELGSGIYHYMYAKTAFDNPANFLTPWANPLYILVAAPFAQFGLKGVYFLNIVCAIVSSLLCGSVARKLNLRYAWLSPFLLILTPVYFLLLPTGLTEPFFALFLIYCIYLFVNDKPASAAFFASFLPFAGMDGYLFLIPMAIALVLCKKMKLIPNLFLGTFFYSLLGYIFFGDFFHWIDNYTGTFFYFAGHLELMYGIGVELFFLMGIFFAARFLILQQMKKESETADFSKTKYATEYILVFGSAILFFIAKSTFVSLAIFATVGMDRELSGIAPVAVLVALKGLNGIHEFFEKKNLKKVMLFFVPAALIIICVIFFSRNLFPPKSTPETDLVEKVTEWLKKEKLNNNKIYFTHPYFILTLGLDPIEKKNSEELTSVPSSDSVAVGGIIILEKKNGAQTYGFPIEDIEKDTTFRGRYYTASSETKKPDENHKMEVFIYEKIKSSLK